MNGSGLHALDVVEAWQHAERIVPREQLHFTLAFRHRRRPRGRAGGRGRRRGRAPPHAGPLPRDAERRHARLRRRGRPRGDARGRSPGAGWNGSSTRCGRWPAPAPHRVVFGSSQDSTQTWRTWEHVFPPPLSLSLSCLSVPTRPPPPPPPPVCVCVSVSCPRRSMKWTKTKHSTSRWPDRAPVRQRIIKKMNDRAAVSVGAVSTGSLLDLALGARPPAAASSRSVPRVVGQDGYGYAMAGCLPRHRRGAAPRRHLRLHRRRACDDPARASTSTTRLPARRAGARDLRAARARASPSTPR